MNIRLLLSIVLTFVAACADGKHQLATDQGHDPANPGDAGSAAPGERDAGNDAGSVNHAPDAAAAADAGSAHDAGSDAWTSGCSGQKLRSGIPDDPRAPGPWPVGALTTTLAGLRTEVWYPAVPGSAEGKEKVRYDIREQLPEDERMRIPDEHNPPQDCNCARDLPLDVAAGPFPLVVFVHGTAGFRTTNLDNMTHWASRGFVVVAADHPGIGLSDMLSGNGLASGGLMGPGHQADDAKKMLAALAQPAGELAFLAGQLDLTRIALVGHSAGGQAVAGMSSEADVVIVYAAKSSVAVGRAQSMLGVMGAKDKVVGTGSDSYDGSKTPRRRYVAIARGGHLVGGNLCLLRDPTDPSKDLVDLAEQYKLGGALIQLIGVRTAFGTLFDGCNELPDDDDPFVSARRAIDVMNDVTSSVLEETLHCRALTPELSGLKQRAGADLADFRETLP